MSYVHRPVIQLGQTRGKLNILQLQNVRHIINYNNNLLFVGVSSFPARSKRPRLPIAENYICMFSYGCWFDSQGRPKTRRGVFCLGRPSNPFCCSGLPCSRFRLDTVLLPVPPADADMGEFVMPVTRHVYVVVYLCTSFAVRLSI